MATGRKEIAFQHAEGFIEWHTGEVVSVTRQSKVSGVHEVSTSIDTDLIIKEETGKESAFRFGDLVVREGHKVTIASFVDKKTEQSSRIVYYNHTLQNGGDDYISVGNVYKAIFYNQNYKKHRPVYFGIRIIGTLLIPAIVGTFLIPASGIPALYVPKLYPAEYSIGALFTFLFLYMATYYISAKRADKFAVAKTRELTMYLKDEITTLKLKDF